MRGDGIYFWDADVKRYLDMNSQLMCVKIGHGHRRVIDEIKLQAQELASAGPWLATPGRARRVLERARPGGAEQHASCGRHHRTHLLSP